jgi:hypothetical protein
MSNTNNEESLKSFQLSKDSVKQKSDEGYGLRIGKHIEATVSGGTGSYYFSRNQRYRQNREAANGRIDVKARFADRLDMLATTNYTNLNWSSIHIHNRIISGLVGRFMSRNEKISVKATDSLSEKDRVDQYEELEFLVQNRRQLEQLQQESGVQMIPQNQFVPEDVDELNLWQAQFQRLPEEIIYELGINQILESNGFFDSMKEKLLHDSCETGFVGTYVEMDADGVIHVEDVKPENAIYSYSEYDDFRDTTWRGRVRSLKISELRKKYSTEFGGKLSEEQMWEIAQRAKEYNVNDKISWNADYVFAFVRPYDEWNVDIIEFELKTVDSEPLTLVTTKKSKTTLLKKGRPKKVDDNEVVLSDTNWNIYRGVFVKGTDHLLEWGLKKNMIRPQDPKEIGNAEFSYSFYQYQSYKGRNVAIPEKIEEPVDGMILTSLKMQQLVAKMRPAGAMFNVDALRAIDLGLGNGATSPIELQRLYDQTGNIYYTGKDAEGNAIPVPIQELQNSGFLAQMQGLIQIYQFHYQRLKDELGEDPNLITQALQPRVTAGNVEASQKTGENATDYMYRAFLRVMSDTAKKIGCLLHKSVLYGSKAYRTIVNEEDVKGREFSTEAKMLPDEVEIAKFEMFMNQAIGSNPDLILFIDPFLLMRVAKENVKLAETLFRHGQKKMLQHQMQSAQQNQQQTIDGQIAAAQSAEKSKQDTENLKGQLDLQKTQVTADAQKQNTILAGIMKMYEMGLPIPAELRPLANAVMTNVALPAVIQNDHIQQGMVAEQMQQAQAQQQEQQEQQGQGQMQEQQQPEMQQQAPQEQQPQPQTF